MNKIKSSTPKIILIHNTMTPPNFPRKYTLAIVESGANINLKNEATPTTTPVIMSNNMTSRLPDGRTTESLHVATLQIPGLTKKYRKMHISQKYE